MLYVCSLAKVFAIILVSFSLISCQKSSNQSASLPASSGILATVTTGYSPVVMVVLPNGSGICTGTFISEKAVLTASHCTSKAGQYTVMASFGTFSTSTKVRLGAGVVADPSDIALLIFDTNVASRSEGQVYDLGNSVASGDTLRLVGFGCDDLASRTGAGVKRTGTNSVYSVDSYVNFLTPSDYGSAGFISHKRGILGPDNVSGSCFGDSGGPALDESTGSHLLVAVTHAGGDDGTYIESQYVNVATDNTNRNWLNTMNTNYNLSIVGL